MLEVDLVMEGKMGRKVSGWEVVLGERGEVVFVERRRRMRKKCTRWVRAEKKVDLVADESGLVREV